MGIGPFRLPRKRGLGHTFPSQKPGVLETNLTRNHEVVGSIPGLINWAKELALP